MRTCNNNARAYHHTTHATCCAHTLLYVQRQPLSGAEDSDQKQWLATLVLSTSTSSVVSAQRQQYEQDHAAPVPHDHILQP